MSIHETNPAGRLWLFATATFQSPDTAPVRQTWERYLDAGTPPVYFARMGEVLLLPQQIRNAIEVAESPIFPKENLLRGVDPIESMLFADPSGANTGQWFKGQFHIGHLNDLESASHFLASIARSADISDDDLNSIREMANQIATVAADSTDLDPQVQEAVIRYAHGLIRACDMFKVAGSRALIDELDRFFGVATRNEMKKRTPKEIWKLVTIVSGVVLTATQLINAPYEVGNAISNYSTVFKLPVLTDAPALLTRDDA